MLLTGCKSDSSADPELGSLNTEIKVDPTLIKRVDAPRALLSRTETSPINKELSPSNTDATSEPLVQISGVVTFEDGSPITSATVELWQNGKTILGHNRANQRLDISKVDVRGRYQVIGSDGTGLSLEVKGISCAIANLASATNYSTASRVRHLTQDFIIPPPHSIRGRVLDQSGDPVGSATVSLRSEDVETDGWYYSNQQTTVSASGEFELIGVATGNATLGAAAPGYAPAFTTIAVPTSGPVELTITAGNTVLYGQVVMFPDDQPVAGGQISSRLAGKVATLGLSQLSATTAVTDSNGSFRLDGLAAGTNLLSVTAANGEELWEAPGEKLDAMSPTLFANQTSEVALRVFPGYALTGLVADKETSEPLSGVKLRLYVEKKLFQETYSDSNGKYTFRKAPPRALAIGASYPGFSIVSDYSGIGSDTGTVFVPKSEVSDKIATNIQMIPVVQLAGRVENRDGLPVPNAEVKWKGTETEEEVATTDAEGKFRFELQPFQQGVLEVSASGYAFHRTPDQVKLNQADIKDIVIILDRGATVNGRVVTPEGKPVPRASVRTTNPPFSVGSRLLYGGRWFGNTDSAGAFHVDTLETGQATFKATADGFAPGTAVVDAKPGDILDVEIELQEELTIEGRVVDAKDEPVRADVMAYNGEVVATDADGYFQLGGLENREVHLVVSAKDGPQSKDLNVKAGTKDLIVRLDTEEVTVFCQLVDRITGEPIDSYKIESVTGSADVSKTDKPGTFELKLQQNPKGRLARIRISADGYATKTFPIQIPDGVDEHHETLEMGAGSGVSGRVVSATNNKPLADIPVTGYEGSDSSLGRPLSNSISDEDGSFLIMNLPVGDVKIAAMPAHPLTGAILGAKIEEGQVTELGDIKVGESASITGQVLKAGSRQPYPDVEVNLSMPSEGNFRSSKSTDSEGHFEFSGLDPETYRVSVSGFSQQIDLAYGDTRDIEFEVGTISMQGTVSREGQSFNAVIFAREVSTGRQFFGYTNSGANYEIGNMIPGDYEISITDHSVRSTTETRKLLHEEAFSLPDRPVVQKDFVLP